MKRRIMGFALHLLMCLAPAWAWAASYTFPGALPAGCSGAGPSYTCGSLSLGWQDTITINSPKPATITINGNLSTSENRINTAGSASDLTLNVIGTLSTGGLTRIVANVSVGSTATLGSQTQITGNVTGSSNLTTNSSAVITGNVRATGAATLGWQTRITGTTTAASVNCSGGACTFGGAVTANSGNALVGGQSTVTGNVVASVGHVATGSQTTVTGNVQAGGTLSMGASSRITGNASSTGAATLAWQSRIDGTTNAASVACSDGACTFGGLITVTTGAVNLGGNSVVGNGIVSQSGSAITVGSSSQVTGNVVAQSSAVLTLGSGAKVAGCAMTNRTGSGSIALNWNATAGGVCCSSGGSCLATSNGCYTNNSGKTITTAACTGLAAPSAVKIGSCTVAGVSSTYTTIQAGINAVASGGTVWICPGTYPERVDVNKAGLTVTSTTGNPNDVIVRYTRTGESAGQEALTINGNNVKISALTIIADGSSRWHGVNLVGASPRLTSVKVSSNSDGPNAGTSAIILKGATNVVIDGASTVTTTLGYGITNLYGSTSAIVNPTFSGLTVNAGARGIYLNNNVAGAVNFSNVNVTTTRWDAVRLESAGGGTHRIDRVTATANAGSGGDAWAFVLSNATSTGTVANITDSTFRSKATNVNGYGGLSLSRISGGTMTGSEVESPVGPTFLYANVTGMTLSGNVFRTTQTTSNYGTLWNNNDNEDNNNTFTGNCIHGVQRLARVQGDRLGNGSRGNYWSDNSNCGTPSASGICANRYTSYGGERDNYPLSSCSAFTPIADWHMDESAWNGTAGEVKDSSGNNRDGVALNGATTASTGKVCAAGDFTRVETNMTSTTRDYVNVANSTLDSLTAAVTVMGWVKPVGTVPLSWGDMHYHYVFSNTRDVVATNGTTYKGFELAVSGSQLWPQFRIWGADNARYQVYGSPVTTGQWVHLAGTYDGQNVKLYVNGALVATTPYAGSIAAPASAAGTIGRMGTCRECEANALVDEVKVYAKALSAADLANIYANENAGKNWDGSVRACPGDAACVYPVHAGGSLTVGENSEINNHDITGSGNAINPDTGARTTATQALGALSPATFPVYSGAGAYAGSASDLSPASHASTATLTSGTLPNGTYYFDSLNLSGDVTFSGGTIYVRTLSFAKELDIWFSAATDFRVATSVSIGKGTNLEPSNSAVDRVPARFYLYNDADFSAGAGGEYEGNFNGIVVASGAGSDISIGKEGEITGAFITAGKVTLGKETELTFNSAVQTALGGSGVCGGGTPPSTPPANFNCVEVGANASSGHLYTKLVGTAFNFDVVALKSDGSIETSYAATADKSVSVELVDGSGTTACASRSAISPAVSQTLTFAAANAGRKTAASMTVNKAYANLKCRASEGTVKGCSSDGFSVRPTGLTVTSTNANADGTGAGRSNTPAIKTGAAFNLTATAVAGYNGTPGLDASKVQAHAGAVRAGTLTGSFAAADATSGVATGSAFGYDEVGYFRLASNGVIDTGYTSVDAGGDCTDDFSNTAVGGKVGCKFGNTAATTYFGRFIPDHFALTPGALTQGCDTGGFTYYGQPFSTAFTLTAQNSANATTQNYTGGFARLPLTRDGLVFSALDATNAAVTLSNDGLIVGGWGSGVASVTTASHTVPRAASGTPNALKSVTVKARPTDADGVTLATATATAVHAGSAPHRFGRLRMDNANGSELLALPVPLRAEYWIGVGFDTNAADNCSVLPLPTLTAGTPLAVTDSTASYAHTPLAAGQAGLSLSRPTADRTGYLDLSIDLTSLPWLQYNWDGIDQPVASPDLNLFDDNPRARASFGKRGGSNKIIIRQENHAR